LESLVITTGEKRLAINGDENRVIVFNPKDVLFAERFYNLIAEFKKALTEYKSRGADLDAENKTDEDKIPVNAGDRIALQVEICQFMREKVDYLFGAGTSQKAFGDAMEIEAFEQFFDGITPFIQSARAEKIAKYTSPASAKRNKRK
jgi:hypothetical protein